MKATVQHHHLADHLARGCSAYCRDGRHAEVIWVNPTAAPLIEVIVAAELARDGLRLVAIEPAPEAGPPTGLVAEHVGGVADGRYLAPAVRTTDWPPYLIVYEEA